MADTGAIKVNFSNAHNKKPTIEYFSYANRMFKKSPVLQKAAEIYKSKNGKLDFEEFRNVVLNVYLLAINEALEEVV